MPTPPYVKRYKAILDYLVRDRPASERSEEAVRASLPPRLAGDDATFGQTLTLLRNDGSITPQAPYELTEEGREYLAEWNRLGRMPPIRAEE